jgi:hypothetical protein
VYHRVVTPPDRYALLAKLPDAGPFSRSLAIERGAVPRAVLVSTVPPAVADDPDKLAALVRDVEAAARLRHAHVLPVLGLETVLEVPAVVEAYRAGVTLRELLDAGGRLSPPVAARITTDLCAALEKVHAFQTGDGKPLAHGALAPDRVWISEGGEALLCGLGGGGGVFPVDDVRGAANVLAECLSGEAPGERFDAPGVPPGIASVVTRYRSPTSAVLGPAALAEAVAAGVKPGQASHETVAAWVDSVLPPGEGVRLARARLVEEALGPEARFGGAAAGSRGKAAASRDEPRPAPPPPPEEPAEEVAVDQILDIAARSARTMPMMRAVSEADLAAAAAKAAAAAAARARPPLPVGDVEPTPLAVPADAARAFPVPRAPPRSRTPVLTAVALVFGAVGFAGGFAWSRSAPEPLPAEDPPVAEAAVPQAAPPPPPAPAPAPAPAAPAKASTRAPARPAKREPARPATVAPAAATAPSTPAGAPGVLTVNAPEGATVLLDGKPIGAGIVKREVPPGPHRIEVRLGEAKVGEPFTMEAGGTYTYEVTPQ